MATYWYMMEPLWMASNSVEKKEMIMRIKRPICITNRRTCLHAWKWRPHTVSSSLYLFVSEGGCPRTKKAREEVKTQRLIGLSRAEDCGRKVARTKRRGRQGWTAHIAKKTWYPICKRNTWERGREKGAEAWDMKDRRQRRYRRRPEASRR